MNIFDNTKYLWKEVGYVLISIPYLIKLHLLNKKLLLEEFDTPFDLLMYLDYIAFKYFVWAFTLFLLGCALLVFRINMIKKERLLSRQFWCSAVGIGILLLMLVLLIIFINNPILRAVALASLILLGLATVACS